MKQWVLAAVMFGVGLSGSAAAQDANISSCTQSVNEAIQKSIKSFSSDWTPALKLATGCVNNYPKSPHVYLTRAQVYMYLDQREKAIQDYSEAIALDAKFAQAYAERGQLYYFDQEPEAALADFNRALELNVDSAQTYLLRGMVFEGQNKYQSALADYAQAIVQGRRMQPLDAMAYKQRAYLYLKTFQLPLAIQDFTQWLTLDVDKAEAYTGRALAYELMGEPLKALADYTALLKIDPSDLLAYSRRAEIYLDQGKPQQAKADFQAILKLDPAQAFTQSRLKRLLPLSPQEHYAQGMQAAKEQSYLMAQASFTACLRAKPDALPCLLERGKVHAKLRNLELALQDYQPVVAQADEMGEMAFVPYLMRGFLYRFMGENELAKADLNKVLSINPTIQEARDALEQL